LRRRVAQQNKEAAKSLLKTAALNDLRVFFAERLKIYGLNDPIAKLSKQSLAEVVGDAITLTQDEYNTSHNMNYEDHVAFTLRQQSSQSFAPQLTYSSRAETRPHQAQSQLTSKPAQPQLTFPEDHPLPPHRPDDEFRIPILTSIHDVDSYLPYISQAQTEGLHRLAAWRDLLPEAELLHVVNQVLQGDTKCLNDILSTPIDSSGQPATSATAQSKLYSRLPMRPGHTVSNGDYSDDCSLTRRHTHNRVFDDDDGDDEMFSRDFSHLQINEDYDEGYGDECQSYK
jgi:hypothetical protein